VCLLAAQFQAKRLRCVVRGLFSYRKRRPFSIREWEIYMLLSQRHLGRKASLLRFFGGIVIVVSLSATLLAQPSPRVIERSPLAPETGEEARLRVNTEVVSLTVSVSDQEGRFLPGLTKQDFKVMDDRVIQEISYFSDGDAPASVGIVFDLSSSMSVGKPVIRRTSIF
jgi:hypothetical protein